MPLGGLSFSVVPPQSYMFLRRMGVVSTALPAWAAPVPATSLIFTLSKTLALIGLLSSTVTVSELQSTVPVGSNVPAVSEVGVALSALMTLPPWEYWPLISVVPALLAKMIGYIPVKSTVAEPSGLIVRVKPPPPELLISAPATLSVRSMPVAFQVPTRHAGTAPPLELATPVGAYLLGVDAHPARDQDRADPGVQVPLGGVGEVMDGQGGDHRVERPGRERFGQVGDEYPMRRAQAGQPLARDGQHRWCPVDQREPGVRHGRGQRAGEQAGTRAEVEHLCGGTPIQGRRDHRHRGAVEVVEARDEPPPRRVVRVRGRLEHASDIAHALRLVSHVKNRVLTTGHPHHSPLPEARVKSS